MARGRYNNKNRGRGGGGRGRGRGRGGGGGGGGSRQFQDNRVSFADVDKKNEKFERYYNALDIVPTGPERDAFWLTLRRELPNSFRFTGSKGHALSVRSNLVERFFPILKEIKHDGRPVELPKEMPWYPEGLAYSMTTPKNVVRKYEPFKEFQKFLVSETNVGNISRQEQVSMIPPLLLVVRPEHTVLDLCAAPGSKSAQLIEAIHAGEEERVERAIRAAKGESSTNGVAVSDDVMQDQGRTTGLLVANDVNYQRAQMLVHQVKRLNSPNLIVTNHDATLFPSIELPTPPAGAGEPKKGKYLKFDRILADVPCSGDGTCRKNPSIWKEWSPQNGLGLYITQVRILTRALQMLKAGGRVVYSTCSLNPVENEAVVSSAIERCGGVAKVKLLNCSDQLPGLLRKPGLEDWSIMSRDARIYESYPEAEQYEPEGSKIVPGMFPPGPEEEIPLKHCMRVYPHQQDTGGFFIAVLEKLTEIRAKPEAESKSMKKDWTFDESEASGTRVQAEPEPMERQQTMVGKLMDEIENPKEPAESSADTSSAAAIQNSGVQPDVLPGASPKRKASEVDDDEVAAKRVKVVDVGNDDEVAMEDADDVQLFQEATDADQAIKVLDDDDDPTTTDTPDATTPSALPSAPPRKRRRDNDAPVNEESFKYLDPAHPELDSIYTFYALHASFPRDRFLVRNPAGDPVKGIYYSSQLVKDILVSNEGRGMKFVHAGVKMFMKQDVQGQKEVCRWRIQTEGLPIIEGWVGERRTVRLWKRSTLRKLLVEMFPKVGAEDVEDGTGWKALDEIGEQVLKMGMGCCVLRVEAREGDEGFKEPLVLPLWRSLHSLNLMLPKEDRKAMLLRIYNEDVELVNHSDSRQAPPQNKDTEEKSKGSVPAQAEAEELQRRIAEAPDEETTDAGRTDGGVPVGEPYLPAEAKEPALAAEAAEQTALTEEDRERAEEMEVLEDDDRKIAAAMPERKGEGDDYNTTV
ncbi:tRNA (cytosine-5-)-methyltransferase ncl1 [Vermiconidia calcicola]|uniref:tRNA (Cytosine-5-)-methyltransferase ncl1 n=1 Tax=Vermiconidia calcicola TaxID=1690605 RepID=A0ACC3MYN7_9PEZI|nr:tRNA (cytosine-5-)-methyltransferase ncl1 [Vermiconidia calcicola]